MLEFTEYIYTLNINLNKSRKMPILYLLSSHVNPMTKLIILCLLTVENSREKKLTPKHLAFNILGLNKPLFFNKLTKVKIFFKHINYVVSDKRILSHLGRNKHKALLHPSLWLNSSTKFQLHNFYFISGAQSINSNSM